MQTIDIYRSSEFFVTIKPDENSAQSKVVMGENVIRISFEDSRYINFKINDYCSVFGEKYILIGIPTPTKLSQFRYKYTLEMHSEAALLSRIQYLFLGDDNTLKESDFSLMGNARTFMDLLQQNIHRIDSSWTIGEVIPSGYKNITFQTDNCFNALGIIAEEFETEFWIEGKVIHLAKRSKDTGWTFKHGQNLGLTEITRQPVDGGGVVTRLYAFGSDRNIPSSYRNFSKRLKMTGGIQYLEKNVDQYGVIEYTKIFDDIYPTRTGSVTSVNALDPFMFIDTNIDFDLNSYLLPGITAKVTFNTGQLSGYTLEVRSFNNSTKEVKLLLSKDEKTLDIPNESIRPAIGDQYVFVDIMLPQPYIDEAETRLKKAAEDLLLEASEPKVKFAIVFDQKYLKRRNIAPKIGDLIWISDDHYEINRRIRVTSTVRKIVQEWDLSVDVADMVTAGKIDVIINNQNSNAREIVDIASYLKNNPTLQNNRVVGDLFILDGSVVANNLPITNSMTGFSDLVVENSSGRIYKRIG